MLGSDAAWKQALLVAEELPLLQHTTLLQSAELYRISTNNSKTQKQGASAKSIEFRHMIDNNNAPLLETAGEAPLLHHRRLPACGVRRTATASVVFWAMQSPTTCAFSPQRQAFSITLSDGDDFDGGGAHHRRRRHHYHMRYVSSNMPHACANVQFCQEISNGIVELHRN